MPGPLKPGNPSPKTGDYTVRGPRGGVVRTGVTVPRGNTMPPTPKPNQTYHKPGK